MESLKTWVFLFGVPCSKKVILILHSLKLTASLHLKMDGWNTFSFPFGAFRPIFRGENVRFRECITTVTPIYKAIYIYIYGL